MINTKINASDLVHHVLREAFLASNLQNYTDTIEMMEKPPRWQTWAAGLTIVSACSYAAPLGILLLPCLSKSLYERIMTFLIALGIGALSGSTMFIMVPQAFNLPELDDFYYHGKASLILAALYSFFAVDRILQYILELRGRRQAKRKVHSSTIQSIMNTPKIKVRNATEETTVSEKDGKLSREREGSRSEREDKEKAELAEGLEYAMMNNALVRTFSTRRRMAVITTVDDLVFQDGHDKQKEAHGGGGFLNTVGQDLRRSLSMRRPRENDEEEETGTSQEPVVEYTNRKKSDEEVTVDIKIVEKRVLEPGAVEVASVAYMIIFGSSANNFVDGMSMGAAFSDSILRGMSIGIAVISQQFPQELGTLAILVKSGLGVRRTLLFNLIPIVLSYLGFAVGVLLENVDEGYDDYIFAISSGMYMYIFLGTLIPEIRDSTNELIKTDFRESLLVSFLQAVGIASGIVFMYVMSTIGEVNV